MEKAIFLDRDGVINEVLSQRVKFVNKPDQFFLLNGVGNAINKLNKAGFLIFVVTNQGGVGLGYMKESMLIQIHEKMKNDLKVYGASIEEVAYCPHKPKAGCECRKPGAKMILDLINKYQINVKESFMIGDRDVDIMAGKEAGLHALLVGGDQFDLADQHFKDLPEAVNWILREGISLVSK